MKKRIVCLFLVTMMFCSLVVPAAASSYGEFTDAAGSVWEVTFSGEGNLTSVRLGVADRLAALARALYPFFELEQRLESLSDMPEVMDFYVQLQAVEPVRKILLQFYPGEFTLITQGDPRTVIDFASQQLNSEAGKALHEAMMPLKGSEIDLLDFRTVESLKFVYKDWRMEEIYDGLKEVITTHYGDTAFIQLLESMEAVTFGGLVEVPAEPVCTVQDLIP